LKEGKRRREVEGRKTKGKKRRTEDEGMKEDEGQNEDDGGEMTEGR
jgi:hypothetical protein